MLMFPGPMKVLQLRELILFWLCGQFGYIFFGEHVVAHTRRTSTSNHVSGTTESHRCLLNTAKQDSQGVKCKQQLQSKE